ncbi:sodium:solute symporter family protein [Cardinium endosymbiont of Culicoides punctatus]|uniref:sodium:solute symporter family protein n=1 Tax=Cardinium endosymbiont of Culicoides punctatus TaxID=2304601 RepID=UPI0010590F8D|nr:hypothetical protein [Cardinium endosymbiont of Culicoides punctatus]TDG94946.1 hypothetical protein CCPUN_07020 [Cardinium endosymbiont of Culicoides punctatus]
MNIDFLIVAIFLMATLVIGFHYTLKETTFQEYAVGDKKIGTWVLAASLLATYTNGITIEGMTWMYSLGLLSLINRFSMTIGFLFIARFVLIKSKDMITNHYSMSDFLGKLYGFWCRQLSAWIVVAGAILIMAGLIFSMQEVAGMLYPMQSNEKYIFTLIICGCVCVYSLWGGAKSVTYTDLYQFLFFGLSLPLIILVLFYTGKRDFATGIAHLQQMPSFSLTKVYQNIELTSAFLLSTLTALLRDPNTMVQRLFVVRSVRQVQGSFYKFAFGMLGIHVLFFIVACLMHIKGHVLAPNQTVVDYLLQLNAFPGMRGILASVLLALLMSTMDSMLHVATVTITGDIISHREESQHNITIVRMVCFCSCLLAFILAMHAKSLLHITRQYVVLSRGIMVVFMVTLLGFRPRGKVVVTVLGISTLHALYKMIWTPFVKDEEIVLQIGSIVAALFLGHYLFPKLPNTGWVKEVNLDVILQNQQTIRFWKQRLRTIEKILYIGHWAKYYPKSESTFFALGFYMIVSGTVGLFTMDTDRYFPSHIYWYFIPLVLGTLCATYPMTHSYKRGGNIFTHFIMWPLLLFVGLFISGIVMLVMGAYHPAICVIFVLNILIIYLLLSLPTAFGILLIGSMCMVMPFAHKLGYSFITSSFPSTFSIDIFLSWHGREVAAIVLLLIALICLAIHHKHYRRTMRRKMQEQDYTKNYAQRVELDHIQRVAYWEKLNPIDAGQELIEIANQMESKQKSILETKKELTLSKANVAEMADDIETIRNIGLFIKEADYDKYHRNYNIEIKKDIGHAFSLDDLLEDVYHKYRYLVKDRGEETPEILFDNHVKGLFIKADREKLRHMLIQNLLYTPHQGDLLVVTLQSTQLSYRYQIDKQTPQNSERSEKGIAIAISSPTERLAIADTYGSAPPSSYFYSKRY